MLLPSLDELTGPSEDRLTVGDPLVVESSGVGARPGRRIGAGAFPSIAMRPLVELVSVMDRRDQTISTFRRGRGPRKR